MNQDILDKQVTAMANQDLDALIAISPENFAYVTGFVVPSQPILRWRHAAVITTSDGTTAILSVDMEETTIRSREPETDVHVWQEFEDNAMLVLADLLGGLTLGSARIGVETDYLPTRDMEMLRSFLPNVRWEPAQGIFDRLRMIKTPRELELLTRLGQITDQSILDAFSSVKAGDTEMDLAGSVTSNLFSLGAENFKLLIVASGERSQYPNVGPTNRVLKRGDLIRLEVFGMLDGYHAGVCRTAVVQEASVEAEQIWANLVACRDIVFESIRSSASTAEVYRKFLAKFDELGYEPISFIGHGIGLFLHEEPYLGKYSDDTLEDGMVLGVEPLLYLPGHFGLQLKDVIAVTDGRCQLLSNATKTDQLLVVS